MDLHPILLLNIGLAVFLGLAVYGILCRLLWAIWVAFPTPPGPVIQTNRTDPINGKTYLVKYRGVYEGPGWFKRFLVLFFTFAV